MGLTGQNETKGLIPTRNKVGYGFERYVARIDADCMKAELGRDSGCLFRAHPGTAGVTGSVCYYDMPTPLISMFFDGFSSRETEQRRRYAALALGSNMAMRKARRETIRPLVCEDREDVSMKILIAVYPF